MTYTRTLTLASPVSLADAKGHLRVMHDDDDLLIQRYVLAAAREIEAYCEIALTRQTIGMTVLPDYGTVALPVGPLAPDAEVTVNGLPLVGTVSAGRYPVAILDNWTDGPVTLTYEAGFGDTSASVPDDLQLAIMEQAAFAYDNRGDAEAKPGLVPAAARIAARYRGVRA
ncbi:head-tail connector protein [Paracoccus sanguinis]|uniref:head-tail connector protein n=1 Tax=Paracoccus sanguinis TaxID=1545044 RepID=UPI00068F96D4|nr:head-tail connector protein [Paracoccus sanguinis]